MINFSVLHTASASSKYIVLKSMLWVNKIDCAFYRGFMPIFNKSSNSEFRAGASTSSAQQNQGESSRSSYGCGVFNMFSSRLTPREKEFRAALKKSEQGKLRPRETIFHNTEGEMKRRLIQKSNLKLIKSERQESRTRPLIRDNGKDIKCHFTSSWEDIRLLDLNLLDDFLFYLGEKGLHKKGQDIDFSNIAVRNTLIDLYNESQGPWARQIPNFPRPSPSQNHEHAERRSGNSNFTRETSGGATNMGNRYPSAEGASSSRATPTGVQDYSRREHIAVQFSNAGLLSFVAPVFHDLESVPSNLGGTSADQSPQPPRLPRLDLKLNSSLVGHVHQELESHVRERNVLRGDLSQVAEHFYKVQRHGDGEGINVFKDTYRPMVQMSEATRKDIAKLFSNYKN
jgi:hypothetical protein